MSPPPLLQSLTLRDHAIFYCIRFLLWFRYEWVPILAPVKIMLFLIWFSLMLLPGGWVKDRGGQRGGKDGNGRGKMK